MLAKARRRIPSTPCLCETIQFYGFWLWRVLNLFCIGSVQTAQGSPGGPCAGFSTCSTIRGGCHFRLITTSENEPAKIKIHNAQASNFTAPLFTTIAAAFAKPLPFMACSDFLPWLLIQLPCFSSKVSIRYIGPTRVLLPLFLECGDLLVSSHVFISLLLLSYMSDPRTSNYWIYSGLGI